MKSPFVRFPCRCIGVSLDRPSKINVNCIDCLIVHACDADNGTTFEIRPLDLEKIVPLNEEETIRIIDRLAFLIALGYLLQKETNRELVDDCLEILGQAVDTSPDNLIRCQVSPDERPGHVIDYLETLLGFYRDGRHETIDWNHVENNIKFLRSYHE
jgi:hypothetical protein